jgi:HK97 family phage major capsid protein
MSQAEASQVQKELNQTLGAIKSFQEEQAKELKDSKEVSGELNAKFEKATNELVELQKKYATLEQRLELETKSQDDDGVEAISDYKNFVRKGLATNNKDAGYTAEYKEKLSSAVRASLSKKYKGKLPQAEIEEMAKKFVSTDIAGQGGLLLAPAIIEDIEEARAFNETGLLSVSDQETVRGQQAIITYSYTRPESYLSIEREEDSNESEMNFAQIEAQMQKIVSRVPISREAMDSPYNFQNRVENAILRDFGGKKGYLAVHGSKKVKGLNSYELTTGGFERGKVGSVEYTGSTFGYKDLLKLTTGALASKYQLNAKLLVSRASLVALQTMVDDANRPVFQIVLAPNGRSFLWEGVEVVIDDFLGINKDESAIDLSASGARAVYYGDFSQGYISLNNPQIGMVPDNTKVGKYIVQAYTYTGGLVKDYDAIKCLVKS